MATITRSRPSSILLQPYQPASSNSLTSSDSSISSHTAPKRIRFAPLPEPNRDEPSLDPTQISQPATEACDPDPPPPPVTEDLLSSSGSSSSSSQSTTSTPLIYSQDFTPNSSVGSSLVIQVSTLPSKTNNVVDAPDSNNDTFTLGALNLFRTTSRETTCSTRSARANGSRWNLGRLSSLGGSNITLPGSFPLSRTQSTQSTQSTHSYKSKSFSLFPSFSSSSPSDSKTIPKSKPTPVGQQQATNRHKGTRMLNGRVYGGPKKNPNPFANIPDEEPEFVEWGFGGMGSVKGVKSAGVSGNWERLHGGLALGDRTQTEVGVGGAGAGDTDLDDGSGMAWLKKRREERERKANEQKEAEKENSESQTLSSPPSAVESATHTAITPIEIDKPTTSSSFSSSSSSDLGSSEDDDGYDDEDEEDEEELQKQNGRRKTGTAAGVEKISRHKE